MEESLKVSVRHSDGTTSFLVRFLIAAVFSVCVAAILAQFFGVLDGVVMDVERVQRVVACAVFVAFPMGLCVSSVFGSGVVEEEHVSSENRVLVSRPWAGRPGLFLLFVPLGMCLLYLPVLLNEPALGLPALVLSALLYAHTRYHETVSAGAAFVSARTMGGMFMDVFVVPLSLFFAAQFLLARSSWVDFSWQDEALDAVDDAFLPRITPHEEFENLEGETEQVLMDDPEWVWVASVSVAFVSLFMNWIMLPSAVSLCGDTDSSPSVPTAGGGFGGPVPCGMRLGDDGTSRELTLNASPPLERIPRPLRWLFASGVFLVIGVVLASAGTGDTWLHGIPRIERTSLACFSLMLHILAEAAPLSDYPVSSLLPASTSLTSAQFALVYTLVYSVMVSSFMEDGSLRGLPGADAFSSVEAQLLFVPCVFVLCFMAHTASFALPSFASTLTT